MQETNKLEIDISECKTELELIELIFYKIRFPRIYEKDWFGLKESFYYDSMSKVPLKFKLIGLSILQKNLPDSYTALLKTLEEFYEVNQIGEFELIVR